MPTRTSLARLVKKARVRNWAALHIKLDAMYKNDNPDLPSLDTLDPEDKAAGRTFCIRTKPLLLSNR